MVVGSGFGGMASALGLAQSGAKVLLLEALNYPGGCASTFSRDGFEFESGATLFSGFERQQLFGQLMQSLQLPIEFSISDPVLRFRSPSITMNVSNKRADLISHFASMEGAPIRGINRFFALQGRVADTLWPVLDSPERLPPFSWSAFGWHLKRSLRYLELLTLIGKPLDAILKRYKIADFQPLRDWVDAQCQITIQTTSHDAETPFALSTMDYLFRGTGHVTGGIGALGNALIDALRRNGVEVRFRNRVKSLRKDDGNWSVQTRHGDVNCRHLVLNTTPHGVESLMGKPVPSLSRIKQGVESGWGAAMLYVVFKDHDEIPPHSHHVQVIQSKGDMHSGNHFFCSISPRVEDNSDQNNFRTATVSTHVPMNQLTCLTPEQQAEYIESIQSLLRKGMERHVPEVYDHQVKVMTASPRTFERYTKRPFGYVGGIPRKAGWHNYRGIFPSPFMKNVWLVGDSVFPGQSALATALGGFRTARAIARSR